jgi:hypothetical protein
VRERESGEKREEGGEGGRDYKKELDDWLRTKGCERESEREREREGGRGGGVGTKSWEGGEGGEGRGLGDWRYKEGACSMGAV